MKISDFPKEFVTRDGDRETRHQPLIVYTLPIDVAERIGRAYGWSDYRNGVLFVFTNRDKNGKVLSRGVDLVVPVTRVKRMATNKDAVHFGIETPGLK